MKDEIEIEESTQQCAICGEWNYVEIFMLENKQVGLYCFCQECGYYFEAKPQRNDSGSILFKWEAGERKPKVTIIHNQIPYGCITAKNINGNTNHSSIRTEQEFEAAEESILNTMKIETAYLSYWDVKSKLIKTIIIK